MTTYFTSDTHYFHRNIIDYCERPFDDVEEMNQTLIDRWNNVVREDDIVYHLGDFAMGKGTSAQTVRDILVRLKGKKKMILGNHDAKTLARWTMIPEFMEGTNLETIPLESTIELGRHTVLMSHYPYKDVDRHNYKYEHIMPKDTGMWLLHGHTHQKDIFGLHPRQLHVGVDTWDFTPVSADELVEFLPR